MRPAALVHPGRILLLLPSLLQQQLLLRGAAAPAATALPASLQQSLADIAAMESKKYNCSISIAVRHGDEVLSAAAGTVDFGTGRQAATSDTYAWGSVTKMFTAASIMKLVSQGLVSLDGEVAPLVDPLLRRMAKADPNQTFSSAEDLWGKNISGVTLRALLGMKDGVPDFDTAAFYKGSYADPLRSRLYENSGHFYAPPELMGMPWVAGHWLPCSGARANLTGGPRPCMSPGPGGGICYSSTNFVLLGLVLAAQSNSSSWHDFDQASHLPPQLRSGQIRFANAAAPSQYTAVHGYDRTSYNMPKGKHNDHDNWEVDGVFAGWTASNILGTPEAIANLTWEIYGPKPSIAPKQYIDLMVPHDPKAPYGLGTFNLFYLTGHPGQAAYGHLGATYGYQSVAVYAPELQVVVTVATNVELDTQSQPSDTVCFAYNAVAGAILNKTFSCSMESHGYWMTVCTCKNSSSTELSPQESFVLV